MVNNLVILTKACMVLWYIVLLATSVPAQDKAFLDRDSIIQAWQSNYFYKLNNVVIEFSEHLVEDHFDDLDLTTIPEGLGPDNVIRNIYRKGISDYTSKRHKWHVSTSESGFEDYSSVRRYAFDGQNISNYFPNDNLGLIQKGLIGRATEQNTDIRKYLLMNTVATEGYPRGLPDFTRYFKYSRVPATVLPETETISGIPCHVLLVYSDTAGSDIQYKVWVAHEKGMLPMKFQRYDNGQLREEIIVDQVGLAESAVGSIWYPKEARRTRRSEFIGLTTRRLNIHSIDFNVALDDSDFRVNFPNGTRVIDRVASLEYTVGVDRVDEVTPVFPIESGQAQDADNRAVNQSAEEQASDQASNSAGPAQASPAQAVMRILLWPIILIAVCIALVLLIKANRKTNKG